MNATFSNQATNILTSLLLAACFSTVSTAADIEYDNVSEDFGAYSDEVILETEQILQALGDWNESTQGIEQAISDFYQRTNLTPSEDALQRLLDVSTVLSAEREASRTTTNDSTPQIQDYANSIAPWLVTPATTSETPDNQELAKADNGAAVAVTATREEPAAQLLEEQSVLQAAFKSLSDTVQSLNDTMSKLY